MTRFGFTLSTGFAALIALAGATHASAQSAPNVKPVPLPHRLDVPVYVDVPSKAELADIERQVQALPLKELTAFAYDLKGLENLATLDSLASLAKLADVGPIKVEPFTYADGAYGQKNDRDFEADRREQADRQREQADRQKERQREVDEARREADRENDRNNRYNRCSTMTDADRLYDCGRNALDDSRWDRAAEFFGKSATTKWERSDAALYWKAYSQNKLGQRAEALATIGELKSGYPKSRWLNDASALEVETRQNTGSRVSPESAADDDLKLLALQSFGNSPEAVPALEKMLGGTASPKLKDKALFMLAQNDNPQARAVVGKIAKGGSNPDLQMRALRYLGMFRTPESRQMLDEVYRGSTDTEVKRQILKSYMVSGDRERLLALARSEQNQDLRLEAVRQLSVMKAPEELATLYASESSVEVKQQILRGMGIGGHADKLFGVAQTEKNPELRRTAIRSIGLIRAPELASQLTAFYGKETDPDVKKSVVEALFLQQNGGALVALAKQEKDPEMKKTIVGRLAIMRESKEARDYMLELLK